MIFKQLFYLILIILTAVFIELLKLGQSLREKISLPNTLDFSWQTDIVERYLHGYIAGRDFIFTYGPIYQFAASVPSLIFNKPSYISVLFSPILLLVVVIILLYLFIAFLTTDLKQRIILLFYLLFIIGLIFYDANSLVRILLPFIYSLILYKYNQTEVAISLKNVWVFCLPAIFGLYTFDLFILCFIITSLQTFYILIITFKRKIKNINRFKYLWAFICQIVCPLLFAILLSYLLSGNMNYLIYSFDTLANYQYIMNIPFTISRSFILFLFPLGLLLLLVYFLSYVKNSKSLKANLVLLTISALLQLKTGLIRSDEGHIIMAIYPSIIIFFVILYFVLSKEIKLFFIIVFMFFYILIPLRESFYNNFSLNDFRSAISLIKSNKAFFDIYKFPNNSYYDKDVIDYIDQNVKIKNNNVLIYPYDNFILNIYSSTFNTLPLQFYAYSNSIVEKSAVEKFEKNPPKFIVLGVDFKSAHMLDDIPNFSRNSLVAEWMLNNYIVKNIQYNFIILEYSNKRSKIHVQKQFCDVYDINLKGLNSSDSFISLIKPPVYFLYTNPIFRLPFTKDKNKIIIVNNFTNPYLLADLFNRNYNFKKPTKIMKDIVFFKQSPFITNFEKFDKKVDVDCY